MHGNIDCATIELTIVDNSENPMAHGESQEMTEQLEAIDAAWSTPPPSEDHAFRKAKARGEDWWQTPRGKLAWQYLDAWALTVLARAAGDAAALPKFAFGGGKGRTSPSDPADVLLFFADVDQAIRLGTTEDERRLILFMHGQQEEERVTRVQYLLTSHPHPLKLDARGDLRPRTDIPIWSDELDPEDPAPAKWLAKYEWREKVKAEAQVALFPCPEIEAVAAAWFTSKADQLDFKVRFLKARHLEIGKCMAIAVGA